jgi:hypothetical protein
MSSSTFERLSAWVYEQGGKISPLVEARRGEGDGAGLYCTSPIAPGTSLIVQPFTSMLTRGSLEEIGAIKELVDDDKDQPDYTDDFCLAIVLLLAQRDPKSKFRSYLQTLPSLDEASEIFPLMKPWEQLEDSSLEKARESLLLACSKGLGSRSVSSNEVALQRLEEEIRAERANILQEYSTAAQFSELQGVTLQQFAFARCMVTSRSFHVQMGQRGPQVEGKEVWGDDSFSAWSRAFPALIPFADLMNHGDDGTSTSTDMNHGDDDTSTSSDMPPRDKGSTGMPPRDKGSAASSSTQSPGAQWRYDDANGALIVFAIRPIAEGEQVLINYSATHSGEDPLLQQPPFYFYVHYGFFERPRPNTHRLPRL